MDKKPVVLVLLVVMVVLMLACAWSTTPRPAFSNNPEVETAAIFVATRAWIEGDDLRRGPGTPAATVAP